MKVLHEIIAMWVSTQRRVGGVSPVVLVLSVLLSIAATVGVMLALRTPGGSGEKGQNPVSTGDGSYSQDTVEPLNQNDTVRPNREFSGQVNFPIPFALPPNVKITCTKRDYVITSINELGFSWSAVPRAEDLTIEKERLANVLQNKFENIASTAIKPGLVFEEFTWEARGVRGRKLPIPSEQQGTFQTLPNTEGEVIYTVPFSQPANVKLSGSTKVIVTEMRANGFRWKNVTAKGDEFFGSGTVTWTARGVRGGQEK